MTAVPSIRESDFQRQVTDLAEMFGWTYVHFRPAQTSRGWRTPVQGPLGKGWPDLFLARVRDRRVMAVELKAEGRHLTPEQVACLLVLGGAGLETHCWHPSDFDEIQAVLR